MTMVKVSMMMAKVSHDDGEGIHDDGEGIIGAVQEDVETPSPSRGRGSGGNHRRRNKIVQHLAVYVFVLFGYIDVGVDLAFWSKFTSKTEYKPRDVIVLGDYSIATAGVFLAAFTLFLFVIESANRIAANRNICCWCDIVCKKSSQVGDMYNSATEEDTNNQITFCKCWDNTTGEEKLEKSAFVMGFVGVIAGDFSQSMIQMHCCLYSNPEVPGTLKALRYATLLTTFLGVLCKFAFTIYSLYLFLKQSEVGDATKRFYQPRAIAYYFLILLMVATTGITLREIHQTRLWGQEQIMLKYTAVNTKTNEKSEFDFALLNISDLIGKEMKEDGSYKSIQKESVTYVSVPCEIIVHDNEIIRDNHCTFKENCTVDLVLYYQNFTQAPYSGPETLPCVVYRSGFNNIQYDFDDNDTGEGFTFITCDEYSVRLYKEHLKYTHTTNCKPIWANTVDKWSSCEEVETELLWCLGKLRYET